MHLCVVALWKDLRNSEIILSSVSERKGIDIYKIRVFSREIPTSWPLLDLGSESLEIKDTRRTKAPL